MKASDIGQLIFCSLLINKTHKVKIISFNNQHHYDSGQYCWSSVIGRVVVEGELLLSIEEHPGLVDQSGPGEAEGVPAGRLPGAVEVGLLVVAEDRAVAPAGDVCTM